jgi:hypothetical protein
MALQVKQVQNTHSTPASRISASSGARGVAAASRPEVDALSADFNVGPQDEQVLQQDYSYSQDGRQQEQGKGNLNPQSVAFAYELHEAEDTAATGRTFGSAVRGAGNLPPYEVARGIAIYENNLNTIANGGKATGTQLSYAI